MCKRSQILLHCAWLTLIMSLSNVAVHDKDFRNHGV